MSKGSDFGQESAGDVIEELRRSGSPFISSEKSSGEYTGTKALMLAVLEDAIRCYLGARSAARREAECWFESSRATWPFSFTVVCQTLGLAPDAVRAAVQRMKAKGLSARDAIRRSRPNVRRTGRLRDNRRRARSPDRSEPSGCKS
jgi:hypothetical protein